MAGQRETLSAIHDAVVAHVQAHHNLDEGDIVTDFVVVAGWINPMGDEQGDGVHIITSDSTPGYTGRGLLATASDIYSAGHERHGD